MEEEERNRKKRKEREREKEERGKEEKKGPSGQREETRRNNDYMREMVGGPAYRMTICNCGGEKQERKLSSASAKQKDETNMLQEL